MNEIRLTNRLDVELVERELVRSRSQAADYIKRGLVLVNAIPAKKAGQEVRKEDSIEILSSTKVVSRASQKLEDALTAWNISVEGLKVLDVGASTGGFTQVLLDRGAEHVVAIDVGRSQLAEQLRDHERVTSVEETDVRDFAKSSTEHFALVTCDVSFISATMVLEAISTLMKEEGRLLLLVKPQFELSPHALTKTGVVKSSKDRVKAVDRVKRYAQMYGLHLLQEKQSPIQGKNGNIEFFHCYVKRRNDPNKTDFDSIQTK